MIAQGAAGRAGDGSQMVALVPRETVVRIHYYGRLYGAPASVYHIWRGGETWISASLQERLATDIF